MQLIECPRPGCGVTSEVDETQRLAEDFCRNCDFPLFWADTVRLHGAAVVEGEAMAGTKRVPGVDGHEVVASKSCPHCGTLNLTTASVCAQCSGTLDIYVGQRLTEVADPLPPPPPGLPEDEPMDWTEAIAVWVGLAVLAILIIVLIVLL